MRSRAISLLARLWQRHAWSLPLSLGAAVCFARLGAEMGEGELDGADRLIRHAVNAWRGSIDGWMLGFTTFGDVHTMGLVTLVATGALVGKRRRREATFVLLGASGALLLNLLLKLVFHRARPGVDDLYLIPSAVSWSFPSGHTMAATAVVGCLVVVLHVVRARPVLRHGAGVVGAALVAGVALSRVYLGVHYPSDVLGGFLASAAWVSALTGWMYPRLLPGESAS